MKTLASILMAAFLGAALGSAKAQPAPSVQMQSLPGATRVISANIALFGHGLIIASGDSTPIFADGTRNSVPVNSGIINQTFAIRNAGGTALSLISSSPVSIVGSSLISVGSQPTSVTLQPAEETTFSIKMTPTETGLTTATIRVTSSDPDTPIYTFLFAAAITRPGPPIDYVFNGAIPIPDNNFAGVSIPYTVSGLTTPLASVSVRFNGDDCSTATQTGLQHTFVGDLTVILTAPDSTSVTLMSSPGPSTFGSQGDNLCHLLLNDDPANPYIESLPITTSGQPAYSGTYRSDNPLVVFSGMDPNGDWILNISDRVSADVGTVRSVSLLFNLDLSYTAARDWQLFE